MKRIIYLLVAVIGLGVAACGNSNKSKEDKAEKAAVVKKAAVEVEKAVYVEDLLAKAAEHVNKEIVVRGFITHTCKHSGRRCFVVGKDQKTSVRVEAKGNIGGFNRELIGSEVAIKGLLKENRLTKEYIDQMEEDVNEKQGKEDGAVESCQAEMNNIKSMREWMKANNKEFYSLYYIDGMDYEVIE